MQNSYIVTVTTEDGKLLIQEKITCGSEDLYWQLSQLFNRLFYQYGGSLKLETGLGSGTFQFVSGSSSPTESLPSEHA